VFISGCAIAGAAALAPGIASAQTPPNRSKKVRLRSKHPRLDVTFAVQRGAADGIRQALRGIEAYQPFLLIAYGVLFEQLRSTGLVSTESEFKFWLAQQAPNDLV
jgi:hypothetical protein